MRRCKTLDKARGGAFLATPSICLHGAYMELAANDSRQLNAKSPYLLGISGERGGTRTRMATATEDRPKFIVSKLYFQYLRGSSRIFLPVPSAACNIRRNAEADISIILDEL
jgi:hypothetical protein